MSEEVPQNEAISVTISASTNNISRKVVGYKKLQPGYRISVTIYLFFFVNTAFFGGLSVFAFKTLTTSTQSGDDYYDIIGIHLFCMWNSFMWAMIILIPSMVTVNWEKVYDPFTYCFLFIFLVSSVILFKWLLHILNQIVRFLLFPHIFSNICLGASKHFFVSVIHGHF